MERKLEEVKMSPIELKKAIQIGKLLGTGLLGAVFEYKDKLIKLDERLYRALDVNHICVADWVIDNHYRFEKKDFDDRSQLEYLFSKQPSVSLTKLPTGIITLRDVDPKNMGISPGIIIPYHKNHEKLESLSRKEYIQILIILRKLLNAVRELADNKIAQEDFVQYHRFDKKARAYNVMYQGDTPQIIDMSGFKIKAGKDFTDAKKMYRSFGNLIFDYFDLNDLKSPYEKDAVKDDKQIVEMIDELEKQTKGLNR